jgi:outer membrane protein assembly factor BamB
VNVGGEVQGKLVRAGATLYVPSMGGDLVALDPASGKQRWRVRTGGAVFSTPMIADGRVVFGSADHHVYAVDATTGHTCWKASTGGAVFAGAAQAGGIVCVASTDRTIYGLAASTGEVRWKAHGEGMFQSQVATDGARFFVGCWDNAFRALDVETGRELWKQKFGRSFYYAPAIGAPTTGAGRVFVTSNDGYLHAMKADTGDVVWEVAGPSLGYSGPLFHAGRLYNASLTERGRVFGFDARSGAKLWETPTGSVIYDSSCAWADDADRSNGLVFVGSVDGTFSALRAGDGALRWQYRLGPGHVFSSPATDARRVYIGSLSGEVTALPVTAGAPSGRSSARSAAR